MLRKQLVGWVVLMGVAMGCEGDDQSGVGNDDPSACPAGSALCGAICVNTSIDLQNCGACGTACGAGQQCVGGTCACIPELTACAGECVNTTTDPSHCGTCGAACPIGTFCSQGQCAASCGAGETACGQACVDVTTNSQHCGECNVQCSAGRACAEGVCACLAPLSDCEGTCVDTMSSAAHCGACGTACGLGATCVAGQCVGGGVGGTGSGGVTTGGANSGGATTGGTSGGGASGGGTSGGTTSGGTGAGGTVGTCERPLGSCTSPTVETTDVSVGAPVVGYGIEDVTSPLPLAIAPLPSGGSRIAWLSTDGNVYVGLLDCDDQLVGTPFAFPAFDLQDLYADDEGGVVLLTRDATNGGTDNCGGGQLCGGTSSQCRAMYMVRFDNAGNVVWTTQVTNLSDSLGGYDNGARFIWWYQHHGRLAFDGQNYAAYFGVAITVNNGSCVDIHQGDRMQVVDSSGQLVTNHQDSFSFGCSHSWDARIVWDPRTSRFVMVCATDNNCRIAQPNPYRTVANGTCDDTLYGGDLVLSTTPGYWTAWSQGGKIRLEHFTTGASDQTIDNAGDSAHPHLVSYGADNMLLAWGSGSSMSAQVRDAGTGDVVGAAFTIPLNDHNFQAFKAFPDGSVAYPAAGSNNTTIRVGRVMPCQ